MQASPAAAPAASMQASPAVAPTVTPQWRLSTIADRKIIDVVKMITYIHPKGVSLTSKRLQKIAYFIELLSIEERGRPLTKTPFSHYPYGPYSGDVARAAESAPDDIEITRFKTKYGNTGKTFTPSRNSTKVHLENDEIELIRKTFRLIMGKDTESLTMSLKSIIPFTDTPEGEVIDFNRYSNVWRAIHRSEKEYNKEEYIILSSDAEIDDYFSNLSNT